MRLKEIITRIPLGVKNKNGRIYRPVNFALGLKNQIREGMMIGELGHPSTMDVSFKNASHKVTDLSVCGNELEVRAELLDTNMGKKLKEIEGVENLYVLSPRGVGNVNPDGTIDDLKVYTFDLIPRHESSWFFDEIHFDEL